ISSIVTGSVLSYPSTTVPTLSPTSRTSMPASSARRAVGWSYAVTTAIGSPLRFIATTRGGVTLARGARAAPVSGLMRGSSQRELGTSSGAGSGALAPLDRGIVRRALPVRHDAAPQVLEVLGVVHEIDRVGVHDQQRRLAV